MRTLAFPPEATAAGRREIQAAVEVLATGIEGQGVSHGLTPADRMVEAINFVMSRYWFPDVVEVFGQLARERPVPGHERIVETFRKAAEAGYLRRRDEMDPAAERLPEGPELDGKPLPIVVSLPRHQLAFLDALCLRFAEIMADHQPVSQSDMLGFFVDVCWGILIEAQRMTENPLSTLSANAALREFASLKQRPAGVFEDGGEAQTTA